MSNTSSRGFSHTSYGRITSLNFDRTKPRPSSNPPSSAVAVAPRFNVNPHMARREQHPPARRSAAEESYLRSLQPEPSSALETPRFMDPKLSLRDQRLDLCFLLSATQSMQSVISMVKRNVSGIADGIKAAFPNSTIWVAIVIYRDFDDFEAEGALCDFTSDLRDSSSSAIRYLSSVTAKGARGGQEAGDVFTGLDLVTRLNWQAKPRNRLLVHISDAPCHGSQFHDPSHRIFDKYPQGDRAGRNIMALLRKLRRECEIKQYFFCHLNSSTKRMVVEFKNVIRIDGQSDWIKDAEFTQGSSIPDGMILLGRSIIRATLASSFRSSRSEASGGWPRTSTENLSQIGQVQARCYKHKQYYSLDELLRMISKGRPLEVETMNSIIVKINPDPLNDHGSVDRWHFPAMVVRPEGVFYRVVKRFKSDLERDSKQHYFNQMEVRTVADHMAREFNSRASSVDAQNLRNLKEVRFSSVVSTIEMGSRYFNMEQFLEGKWFKYSDNVGYVNTREYAATLQAFSHWTFDRSGGVLMVTDLQGVYVTQNSTNGHGRTDQFLLCDPAIHCTDVMRFTRTNLGEAGFKLFFQSHECNEICRYLGLPSTNRYSAEPQRSHRQSSA